MKLCLDLFFVCLLGEISELEVGLSIPRFVGEVGGFKAALRGGVVSEFNASDVICVVLPEYLIILF